MPGFLMIGTVLEHLFPLIQEPRIANVELFGLFQFFFPLGGCHSQRAARANRFCGSMSGETANEHTGSKQRHSYT